MATGGKRLKYGCLGCLGLAGLVLLLLLVLSGVAYFTARPVKIEERTLTAEAASRANASIHAGGRVAIRIREAELRIEPADPGDPIRVEGRYDGNSFALDEEFVVAEDEGGAWTYRVTFGRTERSGAFAGLVSLVRGTTASVRVYLPPDLPLDLELNMEEGGAVIRLAGLWLRTAEFEFESGGFDLSVNEPLHEPMKSLSIHTARGGSLLNRLGHASPRRLDVSYNLGGIDMDLGGRWMEDAEIHIVGGTGAGVVHLPSQVVLEGLSSRGVEARRDLDDSVPTLRFTVSTVVGHLEFAH